MHCRARFPQMQFPWLPAPCQLRPMTPFRSARSARPSLQLIQFSASSIPSLPPTSLVFPCVERASNTLSFHPVTLHFMNIWHFFRKSLLQAFPLSEQQNMKRNEKQTVSSCPSFRFPFLIIFLFPCSALFPNCSILARKRKVAPRGPVLLDIPLLHPSTSSSWISPNISVSDEFLQTKILIFGGWGWADGRRHQRTAVLLLVPVDRKQSI